MSGSLTVRIEPGRERTLTPERDWIATDGSFAIQLENPGGPTHVHLQFDDALAAVATLEEPNPYVDGESTERIDVPVDRPPASGEGTLLLSTGYGASNASIRVVFGDDGPSDSERTGSGTEPAREDPEENSGADLSDELAAALENESLPVLGLAVLAIVLAAVALWLTQNLVVLAGVLAVLAGVVVAAWFVVR